MGVHQNGWFMMVYNGKSYSNGWFGGTPMLGNLMKPPYPKDRLRTSTKHQQMWAITCHTLAIYQGIYQSWSPNGISRYTISPPAGLLRASGRVSSPTPPRMKTLRTDLPWQLAYTAVLPVMFVGLCYPTWIGRTAGKKISKGSEANVGSSLLRADSPFCAQPLEHNKPFDPVQTFFWTLTLLHKDACPHKLFCTKTCLKARLSYAKTILHTDPVADRILLPKDPKHRNLFKAQIPWCTDQPHAQKNPLHKDPLHFSYTHYNALPNSLGAWLQ